MTKNYCKNCGGHLDESGVCSVCDSALQPSELMKQQSSTAAVPLKWVVIGIVALAFISFFMLTIAFGGNTLAGAIGIFFVGMIIGPIVLGHYIQRNEGKR